MSELRQVSELGQVSVRHFLGLVQIPVLRVWFDHQFLILHYPNQLFRLVVWDLIPIHFPFLVSMSHSYLVRHHPILYQLILSLAMHLPILMVYSLLDLNSIQISFDQQVAIFLVV